MSGQDRQVRSRKKRSHYKVEGLSCKETVDRMLAAGHTIDEIWGAVKQAGEEIGRSSIWRYASSWERTADRIRRANEQAKVLIQAVKEGGPNTDLAEVANNLLMNGLVESMMETDPEEFRDMSLQDRAKVVAALERSAVARERLKLQYNKGVEAAIAVLKDQLKAELGQRPDLLDQMYRVVDQAAEKAKAQVS